MMHHLEIEAQEKELAINGKPSSVDEMHGDYQTERRKAARAEEAMELIRQRTKLSDEAHRRIAEDARAESRRLNEHVADDYNRPTFEANRKRSDFDAGDNVNHPSHYTQGAIECIDVLEQLAAGGHDFRILNAIKYLWRYRHKGGAESLRKAASYIERVMADG